MARTIYFLRQVPVQGRRDQSMSIDFFHEISHFERASAGLRRPRPQTYAVCLVHVVLVLDRPPGRQVRGRSRPAEP